MTAIDDSWPTDEEASPKLADTLKSSPRPDNLSDRTDGKKTFDWDTCPENALNWSTKRKVMLVVMLALACLLVTFATSIVAVATTSYIQEFHVSPTVALLPLSLYTLALGFGPVIGGPLSETYGRHPVYLLSMPLGGLFTLGCGLVHSFAGLCVLRFLAGFCWGPVLAIAVASLADTFHPAKRGLPSAVLILMPFLGPGLGPVIGAFVVKDKGWRWTQWTLLFFTAVTMATTFLTGETFHLVVKARLAKKHGLGAPTPSRPPFRERLRTLIVVSVTRPVLMMLTEPIVACICLYVSIEFGTLYSFLAAVPYTFTKVYHFSLEEIGLVFLSIIVGCVLGLMTVMLCDIFLYRKQISKYPPNGVPPEHRLYAAMVGSLGLPVGLFWFGWTAREGVSWVSPVIAIVPFAWGNICIFISTLQYLSDVYTTNVVASASSANSLARYILSAAFPLFTIQMYKNLGIGWASSLLGFLSLGLMPLPWIFFKYGDIIRNRSKYETRKFE